MTPATVAIVVAAVSAVVSLGSAISVEVMRRGTERLRQRLTDERDSRSRNAQLAEVVRAYQNPVLRSAYDLQSRIVNIHRGFRGQRDGDYFTSNTLYVIAEFFGWLEIVRREMQFLDLGGDDESARLKAALDRVQDTFASTSGRRTDDFYVYRGQQRAIGELMIVELTDPPQSGLRSTSMGYATFVERRSEPPMATWLARLEERIEDLTGADLARLVDVQHALIDLVDLLDPRRVRFGADRDKIPTLA